MSCSTSHRALVDCYVILEDVDVLDSAALSSTKCLRVEGQASLPSVLGDVEVGPVCPARQERIDLHKLVIFRSIWKAIGLSGAAEGDWRGFRPLVTRTRAPCMCSTKYSSPLLGLSEEADVASHALTSRRGSMRVGSFQGFEVGRMRTCQLVSRCSCSDSPRKTSELVLEFKEMVMYAMSCTVKMRSKTIGGRGDEREDTKRRKEWR